MKYGVCIIIILLILVVLSRNKTHIHEYLTTTREISIIDKRSYKVVSAFSDTQNAADRMSELHAFIISVLSNLKKKYVINEGGTQYNRSFVRRILARYNPDVLFENDPKHGEETSYVVNKGSKFAICLRSKNIGSLGKFHDKNILQFVALHELSHLGAITYGHNDEFWAGFKFMINEAAMAGLHHPVDYSREPVVYCGLPVKRNPYFQ